MIENSDDPSLAEEKEKLLKEKKEKEEAEDEYTWHNEVTKFHRNTLPKDQEITTVFKNFLKKK